MKPTQFLLSQETALEDAMAQIDSNGKRTAFVTNDAGELVGSITDGDIRSAILDGVQLHDPIESVMNDDPVVLRQMDDGELDSTTLQRVQRRTDSNDRLLVPVLDDHDTVVDVKVVTPTGDVTEPASEPTPQTVDTVLVIGGAGYIGSVLTRKLLSAGYDVRVLDKLMYTDEGVADIDDDGFTLIRGDMRSTADVMEAIDGVDAVVFLGALVGDPASAIDSRRTLELNYHAVKHVAEVCKYHQVNRFVFASTCSVYGQSDANERLTETDDINPISLYGKTKAQAEKALLSMADETFAPTIFRMGTVYGQSPRMRFDLVVNVLTAKAVTEGTVPIFGGDQYRPMVHVADAAQAYVDCLEASVDDVRGEVFNVGSNEQNYQIVELGEIVAENVPGAEIDHQPGETDERSYRVEFGKVEDVLGYEATHSVQDGCLEIAQSLRNGEFEDYEQEIYNNYRSVKGDTAALEVE